MKPNANDEERVTPTLTPALAFSSQNDDFCFFRSFSLDTENMDPPYQHLSFGAMLKTWPRFVLSSTEEIPEQDEPLAHFRAGRFLRGSLPSRTGTGEDPGPGCDTESV